MSEKKNKVRRLCAICHPSRFFPTKAKKRHTVPLCAMHALQVRNTGLADATVTPLVFDEKPDIDPRVFEELRKERT